MKRILIVAAIMSAIVSPARAQDAHPPSGSPPHSTDGLVYQESRHGSRYPESKHGSGFPAAPPVQPPAPSMVPGIGPKGQPTSWVPLRIGAGGYLSGLDLKCDRGPGQCSPGVGTVTKVVRTDTYGAWLYDKTLAYCGNSYSGQPTFGCWRQLVTPTAMPSLLASNPYFSSSFVYELVIAPSNTAHLYMYYGGDGCIYSTLNNGQLWSKTNFTCTAVADDNTKSFSPYMAVDPANENILITGTPSSGVFYTLNGGTSFTGISTATIAAGTSVYGQGGGNLVAFDPSSAVTGGVTQGIYISSYGTGIYHLTGGITSTPSLLNTTGMPTTHVHLKIDPAGVVFLVDNSNGSQNAVGYINKYSGGAWRQLTSAGNGIDDVDENPANSSNLVAINSGGGLIVSANAGVSWTPTAGTTRTANDVPWLGATLETFMSAGGIRFDPSLSNTLDFSEGIGFWTVNPPTTNVNIPWLSQSAGIEQLVTSYGISVPGYNPLFVFWDRPVFVYSSPLTYPSGHGLNYHQAIVQGLSVDYAAASPSTVVVLANDFGNDTSGYATNGGGNGAPSNWRVFPCVPTDIAPLSGGCSGAAAAGPIGFAGGSIAASTANNFMIAVGNQANLWYTLNAGTSWLQAPAGGVPQAATAVANSGTPTSSNVLHFASVPAAIAAAINAGQTLAITDVSNQSAVAGQTVVSATSTTVTMSANAGVGYNPLPVKSGDAIIFQQKNGTGWTSAYFLAQETIAADRVETGLFYAVNSGVTGTSGIAGIWKFYNGGANSVLGYSGTLTGTGFANDRLQSVPGNVGDMYFTGGVQSGSHPNSQAFYECTDWSPTGTSPNTITCRTITTANRYGANITDVWAFGFGKAKSGTYPAVYFYGAVAGVMGYWQTLDHFQTFTQIGTPFQGTFDTVRVVMGDLNTYGLVYACYAGSGCQRGQFNYLLRRDIDPASNDNTPAFISDAA